LLQLFWGWQRLLPPVVLIIGFVALIAAAAA
jgi:hypothetical protein